MTTALPKNDDRLYYAFSEISSYEDVNRFIRDMAHLIRDNELTGGAISEYLSEHDIDSVVDIKSEMLDMLLLYANIVLQDYSLSEAEKNNFEILKKYFKIKEGDFYKYRKDAVQEILQKQFDKLYADNRISKSDMMYKLDLQEMFDLSYNQFEKFKKSVIEKAMAQGAAYRDLNPSVSIYDLKNML